MKYSSITIGTSVALLTVSMAALAQTDCAEVERTDGRYAFEQCIRKDKEEGQKRQIDDYKNRVTAEQDRIEAYYESLRQRIEQNAKQFELDTDRRKSYLEYDLSRYDKKSDDYKRVKQQVADLKAEQKAVDRYKDTYQDMLDAREDMEVERLNLQLEQYTLQVKGYPLLYLR